MVNKQTILYSGVFIFLLGVWFLRWQLQKPPLPKATSTLKFQAELLVEPKIIGQSAYFKLENIRIRTNIYPKFTYGDILKVEGELGDGLTMNFPKITKVGEINNGFTKTVFNLRKVFLGLIERSFPQPQASLLGGILLGKANFDTDFEAALRKTGTIHTVVVSGFNITVVAGFVLVLAGLFRRNLVLILAFFTIVFYVLLTGASPPAIRAAIMGSLSFSAIALGRQRDSLWFLLLAAALMLIWQPNWISDLSFQLSFLATAGIILLVKDLQLLLPKTLFLREDLATTLAAQSLVIPFIFYNFGTVSVLSPLVNALILWVVPPITILGFIFLIVSLILYPLGLLLSWLIWLPLSYFIFVVDFFGQLPFTAFESGRQSLIFGLSYYLILAWLILKLKRHKSEKTTNKP